MANEEIQQAIKNYVLTEFLAGEAPDSIDGSTPLISGGILDSISTLKLVSHLEETYGVEFQAHEVDADYLDTIADIAGIIETKVSEKG